jgi:hypothetical protein
VLSLNYFRIIKIDMIKVTAAIKLGALNAKQVAQRNDRAK